jgi:hypothetical protein
MTSGVATTAAADVAAAAAGAAVVGWGAKDVVGAPSIGAAGAWSCVLTSRSISAIMDDVGIESG